MKIINVIISLLGTYFSFAGLIFIYSAITKTEDIVQKIFGGALMPFTRIGVLVGLLIISIYFFFTRNTFKYNLHFGIVCLLIWLIVIITAFLYLNSIY